MCFKDMLTVALMTFALFLGAGNMIFPPLMAYQAGEYWLTAMAGFLFTGVGVPALILVVFGTLGQAEQLTSMLPKWIDRSFWTLILLCIGPGLAMPRAISVAYELGIRPFIHHPIVLFSFSLLFCICAIVLTLRPGCIVDILGKIITPALVVMLACLALGAVFSPLGDVSPALEKYKESAFSLGLIEGYMTMDALGAIGFGWVVTQALRSMGVHSKEKILYYIQRVVVIYAILMICCYFATAYLGSTASTLGTHITHGGQILTAYAEGNFGLFGKVLFALIAILACFTTVAGLLSANLEYFQKAYRFKTYPIIGFVSLVTLILANFGLTAVMKFTLPCVLILCPVALSLVLAHLIAWLLQPHIPATQSVSHTLIVTVAFIFSFIDTLSILNVSIEPLSQFAQSWLPLYWAHSSWLFPVLCIIVGHHFIPLVQKHFKPSQNRYRL
tara:strand:+ start:5847 stop:7178 length:1332 start_codon:yes stop_codon:yes gene_type:complete